MLELIANLEREKKYAAASAYAERARVVPYVLGLDGDPKKLLKENKGNCTRKHLYLASQLTRLGYKVQLGFASFDWRHLPIPREITDLLKDPAATHMFLYAKFEGKESVVDITWDPQMPLGFVSSRWNGRSSMLLGVQPSRIWRMDVGPFRMRALAGKTKSILNELVFGKENTPRERTPFNNAFNEWIGRSSK